MELKTLIAECTAYDFKLMLEEKKPKSWLKSVSAFANGLGGSLFFGIDNERVVRGLDNVQHVCEAISTKIRDYMDPLPDVEVLPHRICDLNILQLKVGTGNYTPYYYVGDGQRVAFVRVGDESGLLRIRKETRALDGYRDELQPVFKSTPTQFQTTIFASTDISNVGDLSEEKLTVRQKKIVNLIKESPTITAKQMSETLSVSQRTIERDLSILKKMKVLKREGKDNDGSWQITTME
ncbi:MAG: putative DNA binding domain-containing protein [Prevotellaceae bacterium]|nr:putative DNA binding domain-containing protein [Prevotellaceae bacterium]